MIGAADTTKIFGQECSPDHVFVLLFHGLLGRLGPEGYGSVGQEETTAGGE